MYLNCHTYYSLRYGTFSELELLELAREMGVGTVALTDVNNTSAGLNFVRRAPEFGIRPLLGIDFRNGVDSCFVGLARDNAGYFELNRFLSFHLHEKKPLPSRAPAFEHAVAIYPFEKVLLEEMEGFTPHEYIGISVRDLRKLPFSHLVGYRDRLVVMQPVTFRNKRDYNAHRLLRAIDNNTLLSKLPETQQASPDDCMYPVANLAEAFAEYPFILENTQALMASCSIHFDFSEDRKPQNLRHYSGDRQADEALLEKLCRQGMPYRYPDPGPEIEKRLEKELQLIKAKGFVSYFLINWDIVSEARRRGFFYVGRGSGANSIVAYLLRITDVDPIELDLYFERFINLFRANPPDFDIDFSWRDREEITRYIFERFEHVALLGTYVTFRERGIIRELGKVFGLPKAEIDQLCEGQYESSRLDEVTRLVLRYGGLIKGMPNYLSVHAGGILISERPLNWFSATHLPPKGFATTQFDMVIAEDVGLYKFDILGQRGLAKIKEALEIARQNQPEESRDTDIHDIRSMKRDPVINNLIKTAQCMGCFYVESPAMRMLLRKLEVDNYLGLVAASSIIRPGVSKSGMMREYILRHRDPERVKRAHPVLLDIMPDTYGVMVYQEDVIKVAHYFAGLDLGEADVLRRGMSGKFRSRDEFERVRATFVENCRKKGYSESLISEIWHQVSSFAGYAFAKGHSASYAVESYQSLYLRAYFPLEYMVAVLNNGGGFYRSEHYVHEARMLGARIHPPCVNRSVWANSIRGRDIFLGMMYLRELEARVADRLVREREAKGPYRSIEDFLDRVPLSIEQLSILIRIDAFRSLGEEKHRLLWKAHMLLGKGKVKDHPRLFPPQRTRFRIPELPGTDLETAFTQIELLGFCLCSPFELLEHPPTNDTGSRHFPGYLGRRIDIYGYLVTVKNTKTHKGNRMHFATFIDRYGEVFDTVLFPPVAARYRFRGKGIYRSVGKVVSEFGFLSIEVEWMQKQDYISDPRYSDMKTSTRLRLGKESESLKQAGSDEPGIAEA
ncbi:DNA polymerase III, alpha subunit [Robiginitalea myxolifaciens]|uniref:DNA-directed DNA polymerase n=1 Tax=Robiginitalea myxolifaciens TaxID=400055 RepID=A0A1I6FWB3_9FLAO|nr:DNA polymerase III subunit alpha [Robiginitalea myxolifaciens]SFR34201.1 DNA polymerase III, alpha subunit [Robiginitalea myxolifaciens]